MEFMTREDMAALYDQDFVKWTKQNSELLHRGCFGEADVKHIAEEIEDMGNEQKHSLERQVRRLWRICLSTSSSLRSGVVAGWSVWPMLVSRSPRCCSETRA